MGANTGIAWCEHTWNPWWGCTKVGPGCDNCYAEAWAKRTGFPETWGTRPKYRTDFTAKHWDAPLAWDRKAAKAGKRAKVFCASMGDVFDNHAPAPSRALLWDLIRATPNLIWILLTKRAANIDKFLPRDLAEMNRVWIIVTMVNPLEVNRDIPILEMTGAAVQGISYEPALEPIGGMTHPLFQLRKFPFNLQWVIVGGESGPARPFRMAWARSVIRHCQDAGVAVFVKQMGANCIDDDGNRIKFKDPKGGDPSEWPPGLNVRQFPAMAEDRIGQLDLA